MVPTNNAAERALRHAVVWRKTAYGNQSGKGPRITERLLSVAETAKLQQEDHLDFMTATITAHWARQDPPRLIAVG